MGRRSYQVPSKDYGLQYEALLPELLPELKRVILEENPVGGASVEAFEGEFAAYTGARFAIGVNCGTDALVLALRAAGIGVGDDVIVPANTFMATVTAVLLTGATPVLVDPDPETLNLCSKSVEAAIGPRTRAVIPVHLYGLLVPMGALLEMALDKNLVVIEDASQAHGARQSHGPCAGALGKLGCFSFHPSKNLGAFGDGGMITTSDQELNAALRVMRNLGKSSKYLFAQVASNTKLDTLQAAILRLKLRHLDQWNVRRREIARKYISALENVGDLRLPRFPGDRSHVYHQFVVRTHARDDLRAHLRDRGINAGVHYPVPPHLQSVGVDLGRRKGDLPVTEDAAATVLSLPVSFELADEQVDHVCGCVRGFFRG